MSEEPLFDDYSEEVSYDEWERIEGYQITNGSKTRQVEYIKDLLDGWRMYLCSLSKQVTFARIPENEQGDVILETLCRIGVSSTGYASLYKISKFETKEEKYLVHFKDCIKGTTEKTEFDLSKKEEAVKLFKKGFDKIMKYT